MSDLIAAPATALLPSARAMVRVSGTGSHSIVLQHCDSAGPQGHVVRANFRSALGLIPVELWL
ncbi:MAG: hypothetical protein KDB07_11015, partial [Planctomycetes bacterium]|nr:hypothetical protein [Planctomycetota bacterium]